MSLVSKTKISPIYPVILSGGSGTRLWPVSRLEYPKQLRALVTSRSLLQDTVLRLAGVEGYASPLVVCNDAHRFVIGQQFRELGIVPQALVIEPEGRNTAPAVTVAALILSDEHEDAIMVVLPADHVIGDVKAFREAVSLASKIAQNGRLVTFGLVPQSAETGYGYIKMGRPLDADSSAFEIAHFVEKPAVETAEAFVTSHQYLWNAGIFVFRADTFLKEISRLKPDIVECCRKALDSGEVDLDFYRLGQAAFKACVSDSIDKSVMEHTQSAAVIPIDIGWNDVGSWSAMWDEGSKDENGNVLIGDVVVKDTINSYIRGESVLITALGVRDTMIVEAADAVLVASKENSDQVGNLVAELAKSGRNEIRSHRRAYKPWGHYESIDSGRGFQVKHLTVQPGAALSLQTHRHRAEHWVVISGQAKVTRGEEVIGLKENESTYIPLGMMHRLENTGSDPLHIIEVQSGDYLGEDDIIRHDDRYGRELNS